MSRTLDAADVCDMLHFMMEDDMIGRTEEDNTQLTNIRAAISRHFYSRTPSNPSVSTPSQDSPSPTLETKPYIPPTPVSDSSRPYGSAVDAPLGE
jgi:hypothetical protein